MNQYEYDDNRSNFILKAIFTIIIILLLIIGCVFVYKSFTKNTSKNNNDSLTSEPTTKIKTPTPSPTPTPTPTPTPSSTPTEETSTQKENNKTETSQASTTQTEPSTEVPQTEDTTPKAGEIVIYNPDQNQTDKNSKSKEETSSISTKYNIFESEEEIDSNTTNNNQVVEKNTSSNKTENNSSSNNSTSNKNTNNNNTTNKNTTNKDTTNKNTSTNTTTNKDTSTNTATNKNTTTKTKKLGVFSATLYEATAWANQNLNIRQSANGSSKKIGTIPCGGKMKILSAMNSSTKYIKVKYNNTTGYVYSDYIMINLPDVIPDMYYEITNAKSSIYKSAGYSIPSITGKNLYGYTKKYNSKIGKTTYYVPLLFPVAKQMQKAYTKAISQGYNLKIYDSYRPYSVTRKVYDNFLTLYNNNATVRQKTNYDKSGNYFGPGWFLAKSYSNHNRGIAVDIALTDKNGNDLKAQSAMHTLDTSSIVKYNNDNANKLKSIMTSVGFETLQSEWWHFEEQSYKSSPVNSFLIK